MDTEAKKAAVEETKAQVAKVDSVIEARTAGGSEAIGEAEEDRLTRERHGRQVRGEHQDAPVSTQPVEPSVVALKDHKAGLENDVEGGERDIAVERINKENSADAVTAALEETK